MVSIIPFRYQGKLRGLAIFKELLAPSKMNFQMVPKNMAESLNNYTKIEIKPILTMLEGIRNKLVCWITNNIPKGSGVAV